MKEKTYVDDIDRSVYDIKDEEKDAYQAGGSGSDPGHRCSRFPRRKRTRPGCSSSVCSPLQIYNALQVPELGPGSIEGSGHGATS